MKENIKYEHCIICGKELDVPIDMHIDDRQYYIEGTGQLCEKCYKEINSSKIIAKEEKLTNKEYEELFQIEINKYKNTIHYESKNGYELSKRIIDILFFFACIYTCNYFNSCFRNYYLYRFTR